MFPATSPGRSPGPRARDLRGRLAAALGTADAAALADAVLGYVGKFSSVEEYVAQRLAEMLPPGYGWVLACCDAAELRRRYEREVVELWTLPADDGQVLVFEE